MCKKPHEEWQQDSSSDTCNPSSSPSREATPTLSDSSSLTGDYASQPDTPSDSEALPLPIPAANEGSSLSSGSTTPSTHNGDGNRSARDDVRVASSDASSDTQGWLFNAEGDGDGNDNARDDVTVAGSDASSDSRGWPFNTGNSDDGNGDGDGDGDNVSEGSAPMDLESVEDEGERSKGERSGQ
jgi:hypothetical protein